MSTTCRLFLRSMLLAVAAMLAGVVSTRAWAGGAAGSASEVVVWASPGPAMWDVRKNGAELVILGAVSPIPDTAVWNTRFVAEAMQGARVLLLSPGSTPGLAWADDFPESQRYRLGQSIGRTLQKELGSDGATRFGRLAATIHQPWSRYSSYRPAPAGMILLEDAWRARKLSGARLDDAVVRLAKSAHVPVVRVDEGGALPLINAMTSMSPAQHAACIAEAMDQFEGEGSDVNARFRAWADGDLATLRGLYSPLRLCLDDIPGGPARRRKAQAAWLKALDDALATPGRAVALMDVADLLEPSALLAALRAQGATVTEPRTRSPPGAGAVVVAGHRLDLDERIEVADLAASDVQAPAPERLRAIYPRLEMVRAPSASVASGRDSPVCRGETMAGTMFSHLVCHTRAEWDEMERRRNLHQVQNFLRDKAAPPATE